MAIMLFLKHDYMLDTTFLLFLGWINYCCLPLWCHMPHPQDLLSEIYRQTRQSVRDFKPPPKFMNVIRILDPDRNPDHPQKIMVLGPRHISCKSFMQIRTIRIGSESDPDRIRIGSESDPNRIRIQDPDGIRILDPDYNSLFLIVF